MEEFVQLGSMRLPVKWIFIGLGIVAAFITINYRLKKTDFNNKEFVDSLFNTLFYGFIVWKVSYIIVHPQLAFEYPMGILYFNGGQIGLLLAIFSGIIYIYWQSIKQKVGIKIYVDLVITGWIIGSGIFFIYLIKDNLYFYSGQLLLVFLLILLARNKVLGNSDNILNTVLVYSLGQIFLQYFTFGSTFFLGFTWIQLVCAMLALLIVIVQFRGGLRHREKI